MTSSEIRLRKLKLRLWDKRFANHSNRFSRSWLLGAVAPRIFIISYYYYYNLLLLFYYIINNINMKININVININIFIYLFHTSHCRLRLFELLPSFIHSFLFPFPLTYIYIILSLRFSLSHFLSSSPDWSWGPLGLL